MRKHILLIASIVLTLTLSIGAVAQSAPAQRPLRYVAEWELPRQQWSQFEAYVNKSIRPLLTKHLDDGVIISWGTYRSVLTQDGARTHGLWFEANNIADVDRVSKALDDLPLTPATLNVKRHDYLYRSQLRRAKEGNGSDGYLFVNTTQIQEGQREHWREWWDKNQKPNYDQYLAEGLITMYELVGEEIHHAGPNWVYLIYVTPSAAALDKLNATFAANSAQRSPEERRAIQEAFDRTVVPSGHQDYIARVSAYAQR